MLQDQLAVPVISEMAMLEEPGSPWPPNSGSPPMAGQPPSTYLA